MKTIITALILTIALAIPAMAAEKPYSPKNDKEKIAKLRLELAAERLAKRPEWTEYQAASAAWNRIVKANSPKKSGKRDFKKAAEGEE